MPNVGPDPKTTAPSVLIAIAVVMSSVLRDICQSTLSSRSGHWHTPTEVDRANQGDLPHDITPSGDPRSKSRVFL